MNNKKSVLNSITKAGAAGVNLRKLCKHRTAGTTRKFLKELISEGKVKELSIQNKNKTTTRLFILAEDDEREALGHAFVNFLVTGKTRDEIIHTFGDHADALIAGEYQGYNKFEQLNDFGEKVWILLPEVRNELIIKEKDWAYKIGTNSKGENQPYIMAQLPDSAFHDANFGECIRIAPIADVHYGHKACRVEKWLAYLRWIEETPGLYAIILGDLMENALDDGRGMSYDQDKDPQTQLDEMTAMIAPIAHKVLLMTRGNHEARTFKKTGIDPMRILAERLDIPYFSGPSIAAILAGGDKWSVYTFHGRGNAQTKGGRMNAAGVARKFTGFINFYLSGHTHDPMANSETCIVEDPINCRLIYPQQWTVVTSSFLAWENTYAYDAGYAPSGRGGVILELYKNGDYNASMR